MFNFKFSKKKILSIIFLLAALLISLFLGSYNFLIIDTLPSISESLDNMDNSSNTSVSTPSAPINPFQPPFQEPQPTKDMKPNMFGLSGEIEQPISSTPVLSPAAATEQEINTLLSKYIEKTKSSPAA